MGTAVCEKPLRNPAVALAALQYQVTRVFGTAVAKATVILIIRKTFFPISKKKISLLPESVEAPRLAILRTRLDWSIRNRAVGWELTAPWCNFLLKWSYKPLIQNLFGLTKKKEKNHEMDM